jgi:SAM-dependent methyltransferase
MTTNEPERRTPVRDADPGAAFAEAGVARGWQSGAAVRGLAYAPATDRMFELAQLQAGDRVLDVAAGTGETSILAAQRVGPTGYVLATDLAASMIEVAAEDARKAGLSNVETRVMDARSLDLPSESFDAVISRMGIMLMPDRERALAEMRRVLKPGGRLAVIVWGTGERNLGSLLPQLIARRHAAMGPPAPGGPGMFALGAPGLLERTLTEAGFRDVTVQAVPAPRRFSSSAEMMWYLTDTSPMLREPLAKLDESGRAAMLAEIEDTMRQFERPDGIAIPGEALVGTATK